MPLVELAHGPWSEQRPDDPVYALAVYDDGTLVFEGHRCIKLGGLLLARIGLDHLAALRELLARSCTDFDHASDGELCTDAGNLRLACSNGLQRMTGSDHCRPDDERGVRLRALADAILEQTGAGRWIGMPDERQACARGDKDLARDERAVSAPLSWKPTTAGISQRSAGVGVAPKSRHGTPRHCPFGGAALLFRVREGSIGAYNVGEDAIRNGRERAWMGRPIRRRATFPDGSPGS